MSHEGLVLVVKALVVLALIVAGAMVRTLTGPSRRRGEIFMAGTLAGLAAGVFAAWLISFVVEADLSSITAPVGMIIGWAAAIPFVARIPRSSS